MEVLTMRKWLNGKRQKLVLGVTLVVLVSLVGGLIVSCAPETEVPDPEMPEFEGTVLTGADIDEIGEWAELIEDAGGAQNSTILLLHDFQEVAAVLINALDASADGDETPLLLDVFYAYSLSLQEAVANLTPPDSLILFSAQEDAGNLTPTDSLVLFSALSEENGIFGGNLGRIKEALRDWIVTEHGACDNVKAENVFAGTTPEMTQEAAELLETTAEELKGHLKSTPASERLTEEVAKELRRVIVKPTGKSYPAVLKSWWKAIGTGLKQGLKKCLTKTALLGKLSNLLLDYLEPIVYCYGKHFPNMAAINYCLVNDYKLDPNVVIRILKAISDP
jgi:hypothetical protein